MRLTRKRLVILPVLLSAATLAVVIYQTRPDAAQERQERLNDALLRAVDPADIRGLLRSGANPNACQQSPLWDRLQKDHPVLRYLDHSDGTPIYESALATRVREGDVYSVKALLAGGADPQQKDSSGQIVLDSAKEEATSNPGRPSIPNDDDKILLLLQKAAKKQVTKGCACR